MAKRVEHRGDEVREPGGSPAARLGARAELLEAASRLLREGASDVTLSDIARYSGFNSAMVAYTFGNKAGLLTALLERDLEDARGQLQALMTVSISPTAKLRLHIDGMVKLFFRFPYLARLMMSLAHDGSEEARLHIASTYVRPTFEAYAVLIAEGVAAGEFRTVDPKLFYFVIIGACDQIFSTGFVMRYVHGICAIDEPLRRAYAEQIRLLLLDGLLKPL